MKQALVFLVTLSTLLVGVGCGAQGGDYPNKPIDVIVPFAPGGGADVVGRIVTDYVSKKWNSAINVVNKEGAGGATGTVEAIKAKPTGYTLVLVTVATAETNPAVDKQLPYKLSDLTLIARTNVSPQVLVVKADSQWKTLKDLVEDIKKDPAKINFGISGASSASVFGGAQIWDQSGVDGTKLTKVVLGSAAPVLTALAGGHVHFAVQSLPESIELVRGGKLRALAISSASRDKLLPDVPTGKEAGFDKFSFQSWQGLAGPAELPKPIVDKWNQTIKAAMSDPAYTSKLEAAATKPDYLGAEEFDSWLKKENEWATDVATRLGLRK